MLKLKVYTEKYYHENGIGEDAYPFVNETGMFVADGLGGSAGIPIVSFAKECFAPAKLTELISKEFEVPKEMRSALEEYLTLNFASLSNARVEQVYTAAQTEERYLRKKSGYVGSHALGVALALELMEAQKAELNYDEWRHKLINTKYDGNLVREDVFARYKMLIRALDAQPAHTSMDLSSLALFGTTLAGCFFWEEKDEVVVCFFNCGDSRSYVWEKDVHFRQAVDDQGRDGKVGALYAYGDKAPEVQVTFKRYAKPCTIISMTDGVYKAYGGQDHFDSSPLNMELRLLDCLAEATNEEEAQNLIAEQLQFVPDDSASCAIAAFGYRDYAELKSAANKRLEALFERYGLQQFQENLEEFLTVKYPSEEQEEKLRSLMEQAQYYPSSGLEKVDISQGDIVERAGKMLANSESLKEKRALRRDIEKVLQSPELRQRIVFAEYLAEHLSEVSPEKRADVEKNGWSEA